MQEYTVNEYWLTEAQILKLCARSETPVAEAILDEMIAVFIAVRRHLLTTVPVVAHERGRPTRRRVATETVDAVLMQVAPVETVTVSLTPVRMQMLRDVEREYGVTADRFLNNLLMGWFFTNRAALLPR